MYRAKKVIIKDYIDRIQIYTPGSKIFEIRPIVLI